MFKNSWIRSFHFTAKFGSIVQAGELLGLSNSTLSHQIKSLETTFKVKLFYRSGNRIFLTNIGQSLMEITTSYFDREEAIKLFLAKVKNRVNKVLNIGAENPMKVISLVEMMGKKHADIQINLFFEKNDILNEMFIKNKVDILVINKAYFDENIGTGLEKKNPKIDHIPFYKDRLTLAVHEDYLPTRDRGLKLKWEAIMEKRLILPHKSFASRFFFDKLCQKLQTSPHNPLEISSREGVITAVKNKLGMGVVLESEIQERSGIISLPPHPTPGRFAAGPDRRGICLLQSQHRRPFLDQGIHEYRPVLSGGTQPLIFQ